MTSFVIVTGWVASRSPRARTGLTVFGAGLVMLAIYVATDILNTLSQMDAHAATTGAAGAMVALTFVALPLFLLGITFAAVGLTVPGDIAGPSIPDLGFTHHQRKRIVQGALLQGFGPVAGAVITVVLGGLPFLSSPLVILPFVAGWGLMLVGLSSRLGEN